MAEKTEPAEPDWSKDQEIRMMVMPANVMLANAESNMVVGRATSLLGVSGIIEKLTWVPIGVLRAKIKTTSGEHPYRYLIISNSGMQLEVAP